jgi:lipoyl synthase
LRRIAISEKRVLPQHIRVSIGSAIALGLLEGKMDTQPSTTYLMTYNTGKCSANCGFCPQARNSQSKAELLSRVSWPVFSVSTVIKQVKKAVLSGKIKRVCIQALNYPQAFDDLCSIILSLKNEVSIPVSISCQPLTSQDIWSLHQSGADRIGIALDAATEEIFKRVKGEIAGGPYIWQKEFVLLRTAQGIFGEGNVSTHLIIGLGESEKQAASFLQTVVDIGILPGLFAFTPVRGTSLVGKPQPKIESYRRLQLARYIIVKALGRVEDMAFNADDQIIAFGVGKDILDRVVEAGKPFQTSGCPDCNRPFYNEKPSGPIYNFPRKLDQLEIAEIKKQLVQCI